MLEEIFNWIEINKGILLIALIVLSIIAYNLYKLYGRREKEEPKEEKSEGISSPDSMYLKTDLASANMMEVANIEHLENFLEYTEKEIKEKKEMYDNAKERYKELIEIDARLKKHIPMLIEQKEIIKRQIEIIKNKLKESIEDK